MLVIYTVILKFLFILGGYTPHFLQILGIQRYRKFETSTCSCTTFKIMYRFNLFSIQLRSHDSVFCVWFLNLVKRYEIFQVSIKPASLYFFRNCTDNLVDVHIFFLNSQITYFGKQSFFPFLPGKYQLKSADVVLLVYTI